ncbi:glycosyltransferase family 8 protein [Holdemania massiliensis]|uniref:glycosyltransferase family 8 protein n=1 Tax=Holdemania massiliensis TaxID=1468449 RepID=UPI002676534D|nr:glycosyltransferase family 8 protein [Holdemania massiliensis]
MVGGFYYEFFFLSDDKFAEIFAVALETLYEQHNHVKRLRVFLIENNVSIESKKKLNIIAEKFERRIEYIPMPNIRKMIGTDLYIPNTLNMVDFARLFACDILPSDVEKAVQLDCDIVVRHPLDDLWNFDLKDNYCAMINEGHNSKMRTVLNIPADGMYFNSGVVPMNLKKMREDKIGEKCVNYIKNMHGYVPINAQGVMNAVMDGRIGLLSPKFNVYSLMYAFTYNEYLKLRRPNYYYSREEYENALADPIIVHYMTCFYLDERPWMKECKHPMTKDFLSARSKTPWVNDTLWDNMPNFSRKIYCDFCHMIPKPLAIWISSLIYEYYLPARHIWMKKKFARSDSNT